MALLIAFGPAYHSGLYGSTPEIKSMPCLSARGRISQTCVEIVGGAAGRILCHLAFKSDCSDADRGLYFVACDPVFHVEAVLTCFNASRPAFLPSSQGTWFRLENYGRTFRRSHLGQFPMLHRMNIARHRRDDLCIRDGLASTTRRSR
jgi:hypothetical protein